MSGYSRELIKKVLLQHLEERGANDLFEEIASLLEVYFQQRSAAEKLLKQFEDEKWRRR